MGLTNIMRISLLLVNAVAVLSEERFLARIGWSTEQVHTGPQGFAQPYDAYGGGGAAAAQADMSVKTKIIHLISAVRTLMRMPLIIFNGSWILYELLFG